MSSLRTYRAKATIEGFLLLAPLVLKKQQWKKKRDREWGDVHVREYVFLRWKQKYVSLFPAVYISLSEVELIFHRHQDQASFFFFGLEKDGRPGRQAGAKKYEWL